MTGLILKLAPNERVLINGAVIENGEKRAKISIRTPNANVLRLKDAIHPDQVNSPVSRLCYICQLVLSGDADRDEGHRQLLLGIEQLSHVFTDSDSRSVLAMATEATAEQDYYRTLKHIRALLSREKRLLAVYKS